MRACWVVLRNANMFKILFVSTGISNQKTRGKKQRKEMAQPDPHFLFLNLYRWFERKWSVVASSGPMRLVQFLSMVPFCSARRALSIIFVDTTTRKKRSCYVFLFPLPHTSINIFIVQWLPMLFLFFFY